MAENKNGGEYDWGKQLQAAVQNVQWTYAVFWRFCQEQRILVWDNGFYNGGVNTRKTVTPQDMDMEDLSVQRTKQLRELYRMLLSSRDGNQLTRRACAALTPEDLGDSEWFYLLSMSFTFAPGEGLPGQAFKKGEYIWLSKANDTDSTLFKRVLLAKTALIQTVVCIPLPEGVVELGTIELISETPSFIEQVRSFFSESPKPVHSAQSTSDPQADESIDVELVELTVPDQGAGNVRTLQLQGHRLEQVGGPTFDCEQVSTVPMIVERTQNLGIDSPANEGEESELLSDAQFERRNNSAFLTWKTACCPRAQKQRPVTSQQMLKCLLFHITRFQDQISCKTNSPEKISRETGQDDAGTNHVLAERRRRGKLNEKFLLLRTMVPFVTKLDKASILGDATTYLRQLQVRVKALEDHNKQLEAEIGQMEGHHKFNCGSISGSMMQPRMNMTISPTEDEALIDITCPERNDLFMDLLQATKGKNCDTSFLETSTANSIFRAAMRIKARKDDLRGQATSRLSWKKVENALNRAVHQNEERETEKHTV